MAQISGMFLSMLAAQAWLGGIVFALFGADAYFVRLLGGQGIPDHENMLWIGVGAFVCSFPLTCLAEKLVPEFS